MDAAGETLQAVFFVGIAGSLKSDVCPGDVVVAREVYAYHGGKESPEGFKGRPRSWETAHPLQQVAMYVHSVDEWRGALSEAERATTKVHFKPIAAGDLVLDAPAESPSRVHLDRNFNDAVAVEREGAGFANAATKAGVPFLLVRGISDLANGTKRSTDDAGMQETAAQHAALLLTEVITKFKPSNAAALPKALSRRDLDDLLYEWGAAVSVAGAGVDHWDAASVAAGRHGRPKRAHFCSNPGGSHPPLSRRGCAGNAVMAATAKARDAHGVCTIVVTCWPRVLTKLVWNVATLTRSIALRAFQSSSSPIVLLAKCSF